MKLIAVFTTLETGHKPQVINFALSFRINKLKIFCRKKEPSREFFSCKT